MIMNISKAHNPKLPAYQGQRLIRFAFIVLAIISCGFLSSCVGSESVCSSDPNTTINFKDLVMRSISMTSPNEGWAVGTTNDRAYLNVPIHYKDGKWTPWPSIHGTSLFNIQMVSADEGWAVGMDERITHYKSGCWGLEHSVFSVDSPAPSIDGIFMLSSDEGWAAGSKIFHYQNGSWSQVESPARGESIYMVSSDEGWVAGDYIFHYKDGKWNIESGLQKDGLNSVYMTSKDEGWAVGSGSELTVASYTSTILHYYNGTWNVVASPTAEPLNRVQMVSADEGWAVGGQAWSSGVIIHYKAGKWTLANIPPSGALYGLSMVSANEGWAVGRGTILHYQNGSWQQWQQ